MPENETEVIIKIFQSADWVSKSHFIVTISKKIWWCCDLYSNTFETCSKFAIIMS